MFDFAPNIPVFIGGDTAVCSPLYGGEDFSPGKVRRFRASRRRGAADARYFALYTGSETYFADDSACRFGDSAGTSARRCQEEQETSAGIEVMIAFDVSNSMLASSTDRQTECRGLDRARLLLEKLVDRLDNDKVGLVIFAGQSKMQLPLTS